MGRNRHSKDKLHLTATEWKRDWGGNKSDDPLKRNLPFRRLPFDCCSITFQPFTTPMADRQGHVFDLVAIMTYIMKHKSNPCTGQPLKSNQLIKLHFHKNTDGQYSCPITYKVFSAHTHIVFIATTGNVYAYDAVENLNIKPKYWCDLITGEKFAREDIITIQDPHNFSNRELSTFHHVTHHDATDDKEAKTEISVTPATQRVLDKIAGKTSTSTTTSTPSTISTTVRKNDSSIPTPTSGKATSTSTSSSSSTPSVARSAYSSGACAASFTSTAQNVVTDNQRAALTEEEIREQRYAYFKKEKKGTKGYIRLCTNHGNLSFELACDLVPRTCHNFLELATRGYYDGTKFHRLISGFMLQGGDPTATGRGGEGAFKKIFEDEFHPSLTHSARGILSMANSGKNTNGSQFFITFKECSHLDNKHAVFGHLVGGHDVLSKLESIPVYGKNESKPADYPKQEIIITSVAVYTNPFTEEYIPTDEYTGKKVETKEPEKVESGSWFSAPQAVLKPVSEGIGKYIALPPPKQSDDKDTASKKRKGELSIPPPAKKAATVASTSAPTTSTSTSASSSKPKAGGSFGNFSNW